MVVSDKNPSGWTPGPSPLGLLSGTGLSGHQGRGRTGPPPMGPTQHPIPGGPPSPRPTAPSPAWTHSALPAEGVSAPRRHSTDPGLPAPADFPWREEHELLRKWGPGQQAASEQPCPALPGVQSCHGLWVSVGCPGLGGGWGLEGAGGWRGSRTPPPRVLLGQTLAGGAPGMGLPSHITKLSMCRAFWSLSGLLPSTQHPLDPAEDHAEPGRRPGADPTLLGRCDHGELGKGPPAQETGESAQDASAGLPFPSTAGRVFVA